MVNFIRSITGLYYHAVGAFAFILLPFISLNTTQDPELMPRMVLISMFISVVVIFIMRIRQVEFTKSAINITGLFILMAAWAGISMVQSINTGDALTEWLRLAVLYSFFLCLYIIFSNGLKEHIQLLCRYAMIAVLIFSFFGFFQMVIGLEKRNDLGYSMANTIWSTLSNKNFFSECLVLFLPFLLVGLTREKRYWRILFFISLLFDLTFILILHSTGAWMALFAGLIIGMLTLKKKIFGINKVFLIVIFIAICCVTVFFLSRGEKSILSQKVKSATEYIFHPELINTTRIENNNSVFERLMLWRNAIKMIADHPIAGVGLNNWRIFNPAYGIGGTQFTNSGMISYEHPHNDYLLLLAEQGPAGLILYLLFILFILKCGINILRNANERDRQIIVLLICGVVAFAVMSLVSYPRSRSYQMLMLMIMTALILSYSDEPKIRILKFRPFAIILMIVSIAGTVVFTSRVLSEIHTMNTIYAQLNGNFPRMKREAGKADSWLSPMDISSTPMSWYKGMSDFYMQDIPAAVPEYEKALSVNPNHLRVLNDLATSYEKTGRQSDAIGLYRKALEISPYFIEGNLNISAAYYNTGNIDSAYYYISRIKGYNMSMREEAIYNTFLKAILARRKS